jgi:hypothetical protein
MPYEVIVLAVGGAGPLAQGSLGFGLWSLLTLVDLGVVGALVSALHVHAVKSVLEGVEPRLAPITRQGLRVLPVVAAATIIAWLGIILGLLLLIVPGVILLLRWYVVAQTAAIENEGWSPALHRSRQLTQDNYGHLVVFSIYVLLITILPALLLGTAFGHRTTTPASFVVGVLLTVLTRSFSALATALLYFDHRARFVPVEPAGSSAQLEGQRPAGPPTWDPGSYSDQDRPEGWYVDPRAPNRMRFWGLADPPRWGGTTKTPRKIRREWRATHADAGAEAPVDDGSAESRQAQRDWGYFG